MFTLCSRYINYNVTTTKKKYLRYSNSLNRQTDRFVHNIHKCELSDQQLQHSMGPDKQLVLIENDGFHRTLFQTGQNYFRYDGVN